MFGILYTLGIAIVSTIDGLKAASENAKCIAEGKEKERLGKNITHTYNDRLGIQRDLNTHEFVTIGKDYKDICDDYYTWVGKSGIKNKNITEEKRKLAFEEGKNGDWLGRTVDIYDKRYWSTNVKNKNKVIIQGAFYADLNNNRMYVCREFSLKFNPTEKIFYLWNDNIDKKMEKTVKCKFYMDIQTGYLIRKSDTQFEYDQKYPDYALNDDETRCFIEQFNNAQKNGGWHHNIMNRNPNEKIKKLQDYFCNSFIGIDHVYNLMEARKNI